MMDVFEGAENNFALDSSNLSNVGPSWYPGGNDSELNSQSNYRRPAYPQRDYDDQDRHYSNSLN